MSTLQQSGFTDNKERGERLTPREIKISDEAEYMLYSMGYGETDIQLIVEIMSQFEYGGADAMAERIAASPARLVRSERTGSEIIVVPDLYNFDDLEQTSGQCSELAVKLLTRLRQHYIESDVSFRRLIGMSPTHFLGENGHHFVGIIKNTDLWDYEHPEERHSDEDDSWDDDSYDEDENEDADSDDDEYTSWQDYEEPANPPFVILDPSFGVIVGSTEGGYTINDYFEYRGSVAPGGGRTLNGEFIIDSEGYEVSDEGVLTRAPIFASPMRMSADREYFYFGGYARQAEGQPIVPFIEILRADESQVHCLRTPEGAYIWSDYSEEAVNAGSRAQVQRILDKLAELKIPDTTEQGVDY